MVGRVATALASLVLATASFSPARQAPAPSPVRIAILPCTDIVATFTRFRPLLAYLEQQTGVTFEAEVMPDIDALEAAARGGAVAFVLQDPHTFARLAHLFDASSLLQARAPDGATEQSAVVVVRRDAAVTDLAQLRGGKVMFGPPTSSAKWFAALQLFESRGIEAGVSVRALHGACCEDIAFAVAVGTADAGVICDHFLGEHRSRQGELGIDPAQLRVLARTPPTPTRVLAATIPTPRPLVDAVVHALVGLDRSRPEHARLMASAEVGGFVRTTPREYLRGLDAVPATPSKRPARSRTAVLPPR